MQSLDMKQIVGCVGDSSNASDGRRLRVENFRHSDFKSRLNSAIGNLGKLLTVIKLNQS